MKNTYLGIFILCFFCFHCDGPLLSEQTVCERDQMRGSSSEDDCLLWYSIIRNPTQEDTIILFQCLKIMEKKCGEKSNVKPWWI